jgi:Ser/Thr protein kinase RdoA (MazF antagonist)
VIGDEALRTCLAERWRLKGVQISVQNGGMNSATWLVRKGAQRWVAKAVAPASQSLFHAGLAVASRLQDAGIAAGAPVPTVDGWTVTTVGGYPLALLTWVPGTPLTGSDQREQRLIGATLARAHEVLTEVTVEGVESFSWINLTARHLQIRPWIRDEVAAAMAALESVGPDSLTHGLLHSDPAPDAFRWDPERRSCGLIDWSVAISGPLLYDVASAVMYLGGPDRARPLLNAYLEQGVLSDAEVRRGLVVLLRFRWAVQADYFAHRIAVGNMTGISHGDENEKGLEDARRGLLRLATAWGP